MSTRLSAPRIRISSWKICHDYWSWHEDWEVWVFLSHFQLFIINLKSPACRYSFRPSQCWHCYPRISEQLWTGCDCQDWVTCTFLGVFGLSPDVMDHVVTILRKVCTVLLGKSNQSRMRAGDWTNPARQAEVTPSSVISPLLCLPLGDSFRAVQD